MARSLHELRAGPRDRAALLVYADWLQARGHPRGELIALMDGFEHSEDGGEYLALRRRASEHLSAHPELLPPTLDEPAQGEDAVDFGDLPRRAWADWRRGFVRRVDLIFDGSLAIGEASERLAKIVRHPSMALVEHLLVQVDMRGEPLDETEAARSIVLAGLAPWFADLGPGPRPRLDLWTARTPAPGQREALREALPALRPTWFSLDLTVLPPAPNNPVHELAAAFDEQQEQDGGVFAWFDERGHFVAQDVGPSGAWAPAVRRLAEGLGPRVLGADAPLEGRVVDLLAGLAPWVRIFHEGPALDRAMSLAVLEPEAVAADRLGQGDLGPELVRFAAADPSLVWARVGVSNGRWRWAALVGVGEAQALALLRPRPVSRTSRRGW